MKSPITFKVTRHENKHYTQMDIVKDEKRVISFTIKSKEDLSTGGFKDAIDAGFGIDCRSIEIICEYIKDGIDELYKETGV